MSYVRTKRACLLDDETILVCQLKIRRINLTLCTIQLLFDVLTLHYRPKKVSQLKHHHLQDYLSASKTWHYEEHERKPS